MLLPAAVSPRRFLAESAMSAIVKTAPPSVLILCTGNSCRSQMAEAIWRQLSRGTWQVASAGTKPAGYVHPLAIEALQSGGIEAAGLFSKSLDDLRGQTFDLVISVCDAAAQDCPTFAGSSRRLHWPLPDPAKSSRAQESLADFVGVRERLQRRIANYLRSEELLTPTTHALLAQCAGGMETPAIRTAIALARKALAEDLHGKVDLTSAALIPESARGTAQFVSRVPGTICGLGVCGLVVAERGSELEFQPLCQDGDYVPARTPVATIRGSAREVLLVERTCLNFLGRLSGVSTLTTQFVNQVQGTRCVVLDTRKTTPGWRMLEKYAVRCGGGHNHRFGLFDGMLIKDNHLALCGQLTETGQVDVGAVVARARAWLTEHTPAGSRPAALEIEVDSLEPLRAALLAQADIVLLDNMNVDLLRECVRLRDQLAPHVLLEASGGVTLESVAAIAHTGIDRVSVGALTHSAVNFDIGLDWST
jgi:nicotinate-nucleotide pyrophosphorylase (carboxylating)